MLTIAFVTAGLVLALWGVIWWVCDVCDGKP